MDNTNEENSNDEVEIEEIEPFNCAECDKTCHSTKQIFENDHCGHQVCEMCRFLQETKCKSCLNKDEEMPLQTVKLDNLIASCDELNKDASEALLKVGKKRNSSKSYQHIVSVEGNSGKYRCTVCDREIKQQSISYHFACADAKKPFSCDQCEKTFVKKSHWECHRLSHLGIKPYKCTQCSKGFTQKDKLKRHEKTHSDDHPFSCNICSKSFKISGDFKKHLLTHSDARTFKCDVCPRTYKNSRNLANHKLKHTGTKNFTCETCGKRYSMAWQLTSHSTRHQSKRHFKCTICGRRFFTLQILKRHQVTHTEICDYECSICNTEFKRKDNLERHMRNLHELPKQQIMLPTLSSKIMTIQRTGQQSNKKPKKLVSTITSKLDIFEKSSSDMIDVAVATNHEQSVIVTPEKLKGNVEKPKSCAVSVIVSPQKNNTEAPSTETQKLLPYRILPPDKRFLQMSEGKNCVPTIMNLKAMHIVRTSDTGESNVQTIVTTDDKTNHIGIQKPKMYAIDAQAELCKKVSQGKDDKMNKCFRILNHTDTILARKDNVAPKKRLKFRKSSVDQCQSDTNSSEPSVSDLVRLREPVMERVGNLQPMGVLPEVEAPVCSGVLTDQKEYQQVSFNPGTLLDQQPQGF